MISRRAGGGGAIAQALDTYVWPISSACEGLTTEFSKMVPQFKARASFEMLQRFLRGEALQKYDPSKKQAPSKAGLHENTAAAVE